MSRQRVRMRMFQVGGLGPWELRPPEWRQRKFMADALARRGVEMVVLTDWFWCPFTCCWRRVAEGE